MGLRLPVAWLWPICRYPFNQIDLTVMVSETSEDVKNRLRALLQEYVVCQGCYIEELRQGNLDKLQEWTEKVCWSLRLFKQLFAKLGSSGVNGAERAELLAVFDRIRSQEEELKQLTAVKHNQLALQIPKLRRGKMALQGYAGCHYQAGKMRFLSSRG